MNSWGFLWAGELVVASALSVVGVFRTRNLHLPSRISYAPFGFAQVGTGALFLAVELAFVTTAESRHPWTHAHGLLVATYILFVAVVLFNVGCAIIIGIMVRRRRTSAEPPKG